MTLQTSFLTKGDQTKKKNSDCIHILFYFNLFSIFYFFTLFDAALNRRT